jgi:hypothetical protein
VRGARGQGHECGCASAWHRRLCGASRRCMSRAGRWCHVSFGRGHQDDAPHVLARRTARRAKNSLGTLSGAREHPVSDGSTYLI